MPLNGYWLNCAELLNNIGSTYTGNWFPCYLFAALNCRRLSAFSCFFVWGKGLILPFQVRRKGSTWYLLFAGTVYSYSSICLWISRGVDEMLLPIECCIVLCSLSTSIAFDGNSWLSIKYLNAGSNWTKADIYQMHWAAKRYCRFSKVTNNFAKVQSIISALLSKVKLIEEAGLPL